MKKFVLYFFLTILFIQLIQIDKKNPVSNNENEIKVDKVVKNVLIKSCYDCHSNETKWSIYSYIAPISWGISLHVKDGRRSVNFSEWNKMDETIKKLRIERMDRVILNNTMPKSSYILFHPKSKLSKEDKGILIKWINEDLRKK